MYVFISEYKNKQEGPHSTLPEDEFFDAVETGLDKIEEDRQLRVRLKLQSQQVSICKKKRSLSMTYLFVYVHICVNEKKSKENSKMFAYLI